MTMTVTDSAASEIRKLVAQPDIPDESGVRIADGGDGALTLSLADAPEAGDTVLDEAGARVFLEPEAGALLDDKTLDAGVDPQGQIQFSLAQQQEN